jgi:hypothetical protein
MMEWRYSKPRPPYPRYPQDRRLRAGLDAVEKTQISCPCRESNPYSSAIPPPHAEVRTQNEGPWEQGAEGYEVAEELRKLHNEELQNLYSSANVIRVIKLGRVKLTTHAERTGEMTNICIILRGKPEGKIRQRYRQRCENNIKVDLIK